MFLAAYILLGILGIFPGNLCRLPYARGKT